MFKRLPEGLALISVFKGPPPGAVVGSVGRRTISPFLIYSFHFFERFLFKRCTFPFIIFTTFCSCNPSERNITLKKFNAIEQSINQTSYTQIVRILPLHHEGWEPEIRIGHRYDVSWVLYGKFKPEELEQLNLRLRSMKSLPLIESESTTKTDRLNPRFKRKEIEKSSGAYIPAKATPTS